MGVESTSGSLQGEVWRVVSLLEQLPAPPETGHLLDDLAACFGDLRENGEATRVETEERIWTIWCDHPEPQAKAQMSLGVRLLAAGELDQAEAVFDQLIERHSDWTEAWNKRATVYFLQGRDSASIRDIYRALELEPRHFGALGGFAQICMRNGTSDAALAALERLLAVNPGAPRIAEVVAAIRQNTPSTMH
jgi:tetratricopeptide (TPR) repeat protein